MDTDPVESGWDEDARYIFFERLGIAEDLGMDLSPGSAAYAIAEHEAGLAAAASGAFPSAAEDMVNAASEIFGVRFRAELAGPGERFRGEPDWDAIPKLPGRATADGQCGFCGRSCWWRLPRQPQWTCGTCHPPAPTLAVEWGVA